MASHAIRPNIGAVGAKLIYPNKIVQHGGVVLGIGGLAGFPNYSNVYFGRLAFLSSFSAVTAARLMVRRAIYMQVDGMNEKDLEVAFNTSIFVCEFGGSWLPEHMDSLCRVVPPRIGHTEIRGQHAKASPFLT